MAARLRHDFFQRLTALTITNPSRDMQSEVSGLPKPVAQQSPPYDRNIIRTPSPTPSEQAALADNENKIRLSDLAKPENGKLAIVVVVVIVLVVLMLIYKSDLVRIFQPAAKWMHDQPGGFLIPIAILIVLSIPPLMGHEIVLILAGFTWGIGVGLAIAVVGTLLGELLTFFVFKHFFTARGLRLEETSIKYACLARVVREGGLLVAIIVRYSAIPGHLTTAVLSTCGLSVGTYIIAAIVSLPKQFATVYMGYALTQFKGAAKSNHTNTTQWVLIIVTIIVTIGAGRYVRFKQQQVKALVIHERRKRRQVQLNSVGYGASSADSMERGYAMPLARYPPPPGAPPMY